MTTKSLTLSSQVLRLDLTFDLINTLFLFSRSRSRGAEPRGNMTPSKEIDLAAEGRTKHRAVVDGVEYKNVAAAAVALGLSGGGVKKRCLSDKHPNYTLVPK